MNKTRKAALHNLGCKVNAYETEAMRQMLEEAGYEIVPFAPGADVYVINTCTVTNIADRKSRQMLHRARKMNPQAVVVAAGCYVQTAQNPVEDDPMIDIVLGNNCKKDLIRALAEFDEARGSEKIDINHTKEYEQLFVSRTQEHTRAYIKVQDGCNQFCSYCIIPYARGRVRSRAMDDVQREVQALASNGCQEVVLTGIHLSSYGTDLGTSLLELIQMVHETEGISRIRLGSLEPGIITEAFAQTLAGLPKLCPHFHLSLQSGCTQTLIRMNRRYTADEFREKCRILRSHFTDPAITTDVIVGFPGETQEEFEETKAFLEELCLYETHIFKYSKRHGTRAAAMPDQIAEQIKSERSESLIALGEENRRRFEQLHAGRQKEVLFEEKQQINGAQYFIGYTKEYMKAAVPADEDYENVRLFGRLGREIDAHVFLLERESEG
ncbi:tRNA (N(6)-L-threonylcarbamoyladenosine(37)-C(2))-methylthiotransferase MtaB [Parablautia sp. Marseille-Q6255]|uniref:tRNA (N(6)-L-threonylcarbamoyladenosine(37)-C(2))- methylthiotransferase MtaB n=1 Tax=Parablautia sp. Marseille-Q6255 TaxID=3039593 RepID=UPI0024BD25B3|nr:tRNA (N(6)-L-threonylcarbamoyladenosine(37)-C(2))-methylthiotransferase MtaB [Parablautia sp. Marseille-Q6255]